MQRYYIVLDYSHIGSPSPTFPFETNAVVTKANQTEFLSPFGPGILPLFPAADEHQISSLQEPGS